jgi:hypothetical protein
VHPAGKSAEGLLGGMAPPEEHAQARTITAMAEAQWRCTHSIRMPLIMDQRGHPLGCDREWNAQQKKAWGQIGASFMQCTCRARIDAYE